MPGFFLGKGGAADGNFKNQTAPRKRGPEYCGGSERPDWLYVNILGIDLPAKSSIANYNHI